MDGSTDTELLLIDANGCPTDSSIMGEVYRSEKSNRISLSNFDAFRFPTSEVVQFRAMITPCMPTCPPVQCDVLDYTGQSRQVESYGRKKRWTADAQALLDRSKRQADPEEVLLIQTLHIVDKNRNKQSPATLPKIADSGLTKSDLRSVSSDFEPEILTSTPIGPTHCLEENTLISGAVVFLVIQVIILTMFVFLWKRKRDSQAKDVISLPPESTTDSLSYMYESGFTRRLQ